MEMASAGFRFIKTGGAELELEGAEASPSCVFGYGDVLSTYILHCLWLFRPCRLIWRVTNFNGHADSRLA